MKSKKVSFRWLRIEKIGFSIFNDGKALANKVYYRSILKYLPFKLAEGEKI